MRWDEVDVVVRGSAEGVEVDVVASVPGALAPIFELSAPAACPSATVTGALEAAFFTAGLANKPAHDLGAARAGGVGADMEVLGAGVGEDVVVDADLATEG